VRGRVGFATAERALYASVAEAGLPPPRDAAHRGPVTRDAIERLAAVAAAHDVVIGVGGGRVVDAAKGAAHLARLPFVAVPTSPATCAATTALVVLYDEAGAWSGPLVVGSCPDVVVLDPAVLGAVPDRLLAAGVLDAWCKVEEVRLAARTTADGGDTYLDAALALCEVLAARVDPAAGALREGLPSAPTARAALAEAVIVLPGLVAGAAGEGNKLAAAHAVHNALTLLRGHHRSLHGELVAFGVLVQLALDGAPPERLARRAAWTGALGVVPTLAALGCAAYHRDPEPVLARMLAAPALRRAFPALTSEGLHAAVREVDAIARRAGAAPA
jgi:glycerol dehydrogenase-like iron-containing ADH family enzyme